MNQQNVQLGRIYGGLAWPGERPGFAVIVAEETLPRTLGSTDYHCHVLAEIEAKDTRQLILKCSELSSRFKAQRFFGRREKQAMMYLNISNRDSRKAGLPEFCLNEPTFLDNSMEYFINLLGHRLDPAHKTLHLCNANLLRGYLTEVPDTNLNKLTEREFPAVAALGAVVTILTETPPETEDDKYPDETWSRTRNPITGY